MTSLADLATAVGLAPSTVSMALRRQPGVAAATCLRVAEAATRLGYRCDPLLSEAGRRRRQPVGSLLFAWVLSRPRPAVSLQAATAAMHAAGHRLDAVRCARGEGRSLPDRLRQAGYRGAIIAPYDDADLAGADWSGLAVVALNGGDPGGPFPRLNHDLVGGLRLAADRLRSLGCKRLGCVVRALDPGHDDDWRRRAACLMVSDPAIPVLAVRGAEPASVIAWLRRHRPDGIVTTWPKTLAQLPPRIHGACPEHRPGDLAAALVELLEDALRHGRLGLPLLPRLTLVAPRLLLRTAAGGWRPEPAARLSS